MDVIQRKMSFCIELRDAFTNKVIEAEDMRLCVNGVFPMARKEKKYYIFENLPTDIIMVDIISIFYERRRVEIAISGDGAKKAPVHFPGGYIRIVFGIPLISIMLYPNERYNLPADYERQVFDARPFEEIRIKKDENKVFSLKEDYQGGVVFSVLFPQEKILEGTWFRIESRDGEEYEDFIVLEQKGAVQYVMDRTLHKQYEKGSKIYELYCTIADEKGRAIVVVKNK